MTCPKDELERRLLLVSYPERVSRKAPLARGSDRGDDGFPLATEPGRKSCALARMRSHRGSRGLDILCRPVHRGWRGIMLLVPFAPGRTQSIDGRSSAPAVASLGTIKAGEQRAGEHYVYAHTIPTTPATLDRASRKCGVLSQER